MPKFAGREATFKEKLQKDQPILFVPLREKEKDSMKELKKRLIPPSVLLLPLSERKYTVDTDACDKQIVFVLF